MKKLISLTTLFLLSLNIFSQENENILMTLDGRDITCEEFIRVYSKNNNITPESEKKSIDDYIDLFVNFKLKVIEAENSGYDTVKSFINEFEGYKDQLARPYVQNQEYKDKLVVEAYDRSIKEVRASHIMVRLGENSLPSDTLKAYEKITALYARVLAGEPFEQVAKASSEDPSAATNGGDLGYFTAFRMVYPFESPAYNTPIGQISKPIRTTFGYHLVKVTDIQPNKGSLKVSHIMTRVAQNATEPEKQAAKEKLNLAYNELQAGANFIDMVQKYSENPSTKKFNGEIGWLKRGQAPDNFMDACFKLDSGQYTGIIETIGGYHIACLLEKKPVETFEQAQKDISKRIDSDGERLKAISSMQYSGLKAKYGIKKYFENANELIKVIDSSIYNKKWNAQVAAEMQDTLLTIGDKSYNQYDYAKYLSTISRTKMANLSFENILSLHFQSFSDECLMNYAIEVLPKENIEYKYLLREYHDGILLFNLTNDLIWKKAQDDTLGLELYFKTAKKYNWNKRLDVKIYEYSNPEFSTKLPALASKQVKQKLSNDYIKANLCPNDSLPCITITDKTYEKNQDAIADKLSWKKGSHTILTENDKNHLYFVTNIRNPQEKQLNEARGLYISDYQNYLEQNWIKELRSKYTITINEAVLSELKTSLTTEK